MRNRIFVGGLTLGLILGVASAWALQEGGKMPPLPVEDELLKKLVGEWEWTGTMKNPMGFPGDMSFTATEKNEWVLNKQFVLSRHKLKMKDTGMNFEYMSVLQAETVAGNYKIWFFDQMGRTSTSSEGKQEGDSLSWLSESPRWSGKSTLTLTGENRASLESFVKLPGEKEWKPFKNMKGKKKK